jgi:hypothetical protein
MRLSFRTSLAVCFAAALAPSIALAADLPKLDARELAGLVESSRPTIKRIRCEFVVTYGGIDGFENPSFNNAWSAEYSAYINKVLMGKFIPLESRASGPRACESALDTENARRYLSRSSRDPKSTTETKEQFHYNDKVATTLVESSNRTTVVLSAEVPREIRAKPRDYSFWNPREIFLPVLTLDLADVIRQAAKVEVETDVIEGRPVYRVTLREALNREAHRLWLSPDFNMWPVRIELLNIRDGKGPPDSVPRLVAKLSDFRKGASGTWFPFGCRTFSFWPKEPAAVDDFKVQSIVLNENVQIPDQLAIPQGASVTDEIRGLRYRAGVPAEEIDDQVKKSLQEIGPPQSESQSPSLWTYWPWAAAALFVVVVAIVVAKRFRTENS